MDLEYHNYKRDVIIDRNLIERIILKIVDVFNIRVAWDCETALLAGAFGLAGGVLGGYAGNRMGAAIGVGIGSVAGVGVSTVINLREIWSQVKDKLQDLLFIVFNYLRRFDPVDCERAFRIVMACTSSRRELVYTIVNFISDKLKREVLSSITMV